MYEHESEAFRLSAHCLGLSSDERSEYQSRSEAILKDKRDILGTRYRALRASLRAKEVNVVNVGNLYAS